MSERSQGLLAVVDRFLETHRTWGESDVPYVTEEYEKACDDMIVVFEGGDLPGECRTLAKAVDGLSTLWQRYKDQAASTTATTLPSGGFFKAVSYLDSCRAEAEPKRRRHLESITVLTEQKVPDRQICDIYGWMEANGTPQLWKLAEERERPGTYVNENFVPPLELKDRQEAARRREIITAASQRTASKIKNLTEPAPEPWEALFEQELSASQISKMKKCSVDEVYAQAKKLGFPQPPLNYGDPRMAPAPQEPGINEHAARSLDAGANMRHESDDEVGPEDDTDPIEEVDDEPQTLEAEVLMYHEQGIDAKTIAEQIRIGGESISVTQVKKIIKESKAASTAE